ncbi:bifunctional diaminohydroxyphosphoribosylaminopyrimidine deaminase/5-amino-6-(5-phosphoribosylamino)uracil reductase RibD [Thaumasiovibrio sp. DFM-14]|uniref:bifunctional diaminohydroxyphosphoribosylaminopyrimidine deaminase/5-amino-6-(5-phosphoribosylamino)uracil reductase RibD n=1 Tax=Thaumasiovibrio sp. DFM-14 TaxID=3384792 RepID=UPI0039A20DAC
MTTTTVFSPFDVQMMQRALQLAQKGRFTTSPNPRVGCVIVKDNNVVGEGFHYRAGEPHAEVYALREAAEQAKGATAYVTLEPCSHYGRTPPCAEALINAQVGRVVCAMQDPNPQVAGRGLKMLSDAGIETTTGLLTQQSAALNPGFIKKMERNKPYVQLKLAASLDGKTALANGESKWITSAPARSDVQQFRAQADAILSTSATVLADNPRLNVRHDQLPHSIQADYPDSALRQPVKVIVDRQQRITPSYGCIDGEVRLISTQPREALWPEGVEHWVQDEWHVSKIMDALAQNNLNQVFVEAGATFAGALLEAQAVDELILYLAPKLMGGDSRSLLGALGLTAMSAVIDLTLTDVRMVGGDIRIIAKPIYAQNN